MKSTIIKIIGLLVITFSCQKNDTQSQSLENYQIRNINLYTLKPDSALIISIDYSTNFVSNYIDFYEDSITRQQYLAYLNEVNSQIQFYNIKAKKLDFSINFDEKTGIKEVDGFYIQNLDSILVSSTKYISYHLVNRRGEVIKKFLFEPFDPQGVYILPFIRGFSKFGIIKGKNFIYHKVPYYPAYHGDLWKYAITFSQNLETNQIDTLYWYKGKRKDEIFEGGYLPWSFVQINPTQFVYSFFFDEDLYLTDFKNLNKAYYAGSRYFDKIPSFDHIPKDYKLQNEQFNTGYCYRHIIYDKFRKVYYRLVLHPTDKDNKDYQHGKPFSIIILDENFQKIGETEVFKEKMYYNNYFVAPEGLYISRNHRENPDVNEDKLNFRLYKLVKNE